MYSVPTKMLELTFGNRPGKKLPLPLYLKSAKATDDETEVGRDANGVGLGQFFYLLSDRVDGDGLSPTPLTQLFHNLKDASITDTRHSVDYRAIVAILYAHLEGDYTGRPSTRRLQCQA